MNARRESKERNLTWRIQEDSNCWTLLEHFLEHFMHTICRFEAREVSNPTLQIVHESELKWRSYSHWKPITPSWRPISQLRNHKVMTAKSAFGCEMGTFSLGNFTAHLACCEILLSASRYLRSTLLDFFSSDIFAPTPLDFYLKIFCVIIYSLLVIN